MSSKSWTMLEPAAVSPIGLGLVSLVLGTIGLLLFFLPILGIPVAGCGFIAGLAALLIAIRQPGRSARLPIAGLVVSCAAMGIGTALAYAPVGHEPSTSAPRLWQTPRGPLYIPPPARQPGI
ncbi:MAG TPA: hypothetical protein VHV08_00355 [Pirellulales bacterium]|nr:hypothetical protein [Pirellulales bacterium]